MIITVLFESIRVSNHVQGLIRAVKTHVVNMNFTHCPLREKSQKLVGMTLILFRAVLLPTDTIYTERYMGLPTKDDNFEGYEVNMYV